MDLFGNLALGFQTVFTVNNLLFCFTGVFFGTLVGVLPGLGPLATMSILLPITYYVGDPASALIMLAGIYYGAQYGGSTTAILVNLPGEVTSVVTALDGYKMARNGRPGPALAIAALGSFFAGTVTTAAIAAFAPALAQAAFLFGPTEYFALMVLGLIAAIVLAHGSVAKAIGMALFGLLLGTVGVDITSGVSRFSYGSPHVMDGLSLAAVAMGIFAIGEIISNLQKDINTNVLSERIGSLMPSREEVRRSTGPVLRGTALGTVLGLLPGGGALLSSFTSYAVEKKISKTPEKFGTGMIEGVAGPEAANNAGAQASFIPMLTLGIPTNAVMALMVAAMMIHSIQPGPQVMTSNPTLFWGLIASMWVGNIMLVILNLPLIGIWVRIMTVPYKYLYPLIILFVCIGVFSVSFSQFDLFLIIPFGILGYLFQKLECEPAPLLLGMVLGALMEEYLGRALLISRGDWTVFVTRPISATLLLIAGVLLVMVLVPAVSKTRDVAFEEET